MRKVQNENGLFNANFRIAKTLEIQLVDISWCVHYIHSSNPSPLLWLSKYQKEKKKIVELVGLNMDNEWEQINIILDLLHFVHVF